MMRADGGGSPEIVFDKFRRGSWSFDWSVASRAVVYDASAEGGAPDLWTLPLDGDKRAKALFETPAVEYQPQVSPDGRWVAYVSNESGREEVYVQSFPETGSKRQVSYGGGNQPRWRPDGRELYFVTLDSTIMAAQVSAYSSTKRWSASR